MPIKKNLALLVLFVVVFILLGTWLLRDVLGAMIYPVDGEITSPYGNRYHPTLHVNKFHNGIDLGVPSGTPIKAAQGGVVIKRFNDEINGNAIVIKHDNGFSTGYAHLSSFLVQLNQKVKKGQVIAKSGATGRVTGPHLHLTMRNAAGNYVNPVDYLT